MWNISCPFPSEVTNNSLKDSSYLRVEYSLGKPYCCAMEFLLVWVAFIVEKKTNKTTQARG